MTDQIDRLEKVAVMEDSEAGVSEAVIQPNNGEKTMKKMTRSGMMLTLGLGLMIVLAGIGTGYALAQLAPQSGRLAESTLGTTPASAEHIQAGQVYGSEDETAFPDNAEGVLVEGGIEGEGSHHLMRDGGKGRNVYLTSTVLDLDMFVNHKVKVWGETFSAQKAGWLMDVGRAEVVSLNAEKPFEE